MKNEFQLRFDSDQNLIYTCTFLIELWEGIPVTWGSAVGEEMDYNMQL